MPNSNIQDILVLRNEGAAFIQNLLLRHIGSRKNPALGPKDYEFSLDSENGIVIVRANNAKINTLGFGPITFLKISLSTKNRPGYHISDQETPERDSGYPFNRVEFEMLPTEINKGRLLKKLRFAGIFKNIHGDIFTNKAKIAFNACLRNFEEDLEHYLVVHINAKKLEERKKKMAIDLEQREEIMEKLAQMFGGDIENISTNTATIKIGEGAMLRVNIDEDGKLLFSEISSNVFFKNVESLQNALSPIKTLMEKLNEIATKK